MYNFLNQVNPPGHRNTHKKPQNLTRGVHLEPYSESDGARTVTLFARNYLDKHNHCYKRVVMLNLRPQGPLANYVKLTHFEPLCERHKWSNDTCNPRQQCGFVITNIDELFDSTTCCGKKCDDLMSVNDVPALISFLLSNGYTVNTDITKMFHQGDIQFDGSIGNKLLCFITYMGPCST